MRVYEIRKVEWLSSEEDSWVADFADPDFAERTAILLNKECSLSEAYVVCEVDKHNNPQGGGD